MKFPSKGEILELHRRIVRASGGSLEVRDRGALDSSLSQPHQSFGDQELYPSLEEKAAALGLFLIQNHPFIDGNKRIGHAAIEVTLVMNGFELVASVEDQEAIILAVASGHLRREQLADWVKARICKRA